MRFLSDFKAFSLNEAITFDAKAFAAKHAAFINDSKSSAKLPTLSAKDAVRQHPSVLFIQDYLNTHGIKTTVDGVFGKGTTASIVSYQKSKGLGADGVVGVKTWSPIFKELGVDVSKYTTYTPVKATDKPTASTSSTGATVTPTAAKGIETLATTYKAVLERFKTQQRVPMLSTKLMKQKLEEVKLMQDYLLFKKIAKVTADGQYGDTTQKAVMALQTKNKLKADGLAGVRTWALVLADFGIDGSKYKTGSPTEIKTATAAGIKEMKTQFAEQLNEVMKNKRLPLLSVEYPTKYAYTQLLQTYLTFKNIKTDMDGKFGTGTKMSVQQYQKALKVTVDGAVGINTWSPIMRALGVDVSDCKIFKPTVAVAPETAVTTKPTAQKSGDDTSDFFGADEKLKATFLTEQYTGVDGAATTGAEIIKVGILKNAQMITLLQKNPEKLVSLLKMSGMELGKSPIQMLMASPNLKPDIAEDLIRIRSTRVCGEMLYWVLRGLSNEKKVVNPPLAERIITTIGNNNAAYKKLVENRFYDTAIAQKQYDPKAYPLRRWLYEAYQNDRPYLWMNKITAETENDAANYPERKTKS